MPPVWKIKGYLGKGCLPGSSGGKVFQILLIPYQMRSPNSMEAHYATPPDSISTAYIHNTA